MVDEETNLSSTNTYLKYTFTFQKNDINKLLASKIRFTFELSPAFSLGQNDTYLTYLLFVYISPQIKL